jgi:hypothetical protein
LQVGRNQREIVGEESLRQRSTTNHRLALLHGYCGMVAALEYVGDSFNYPRTVKTILVSNWYLKRSGAGEESL